MTKMRLVVIWLACVIILGTGFDAAAAGVLSVDGFRATVSEDSGDYSLIVENMGVGEETPLGASWILDLTTGAWILKTADFKNSRDLTFTPDPGIRVNYASNPGARIDPFTGTIYLYYEYRTGSGPGQELFATSTDGLTFSSGQTPGKEHARLNPRTVLLPDGTWRKYVFDQQAGAFTSQSSVDGYTFVQDSGIRYQPTEGDNGSVGVYCVYVNHLSEVILLYIGDMGGSDNVRRAVSRDGGWSFTFDSDNVLKDKDLEAKKKFVDPKAFLLPDGTWRLLNMRRGENGTSPQPGVVAVGEVVTFISRNGMDFFREPGVRLKTSDFTEFPVWSLNDPVMVRLPDGRYRIYVAALVDDTSPGAPSSTKWVIVSATSQ